MCESKYIVMDLYGYACRMADIFFMYFYTRQNKNVFDAFKR